MRDYMQQALNRHSPNFSSQLNFKFWASFERIFDIKYINNVTQLFAIAYVWRPTMHNDKLKALISATMKPIQLFSKSGSLLYLLYPLMIICEGSNMKAWNHGLDSRRMGIDKGWGLSINNISFVWVNFFIAVLRSSKKVVQNETLGFVWDNLIIAF